MKKSLALLLPGLLFTTSLMASVLVFGSGCVVRPGGHGHYHPYHHPGRHRGWR